MIKELFFTLVALTTLASIAQAGPDDHEFKDIDTCYHWIQPHQLQAKIDWAKKNNGQFYFYGRGVVYCWRSPLGAQSSWEDHGDELIRIKFKPGTKIIHRQRVPTFDDIQSLGAQAIYSNDNAWHEYTIAPDAVESWSIYQPNTIEEMKAEYTYYQKGEVRANDVFYPIVHWNQNFVDYTLNDIIKDQERKSKTQAQIFGTNIANHFKTTVTLPWQKYLNRALFTPVKIPQLIKIVSASYGLNLSAGYKGNVTDKAGQFCDDKPICNYKVSSRFIGDPSPGQDKDFKIEWKCGSDKKVHSKVVPAPAENQVFDINCNS